MKIRVFYSTTNKYSDDVELDDLLKWYKQFYHEPLDVENKERVYNAAINYSNNENQPDPWRYGNAEPEYGDETFITSDETFYARLTPSKPWKR